MCEMVKKRDTLRTWPFSTRHGVFSFPAIKSVCTHTPQRSPAFAHTSHKQHPPNLFISQSSLARLHPGTVCDIYGQVDVANLVHATCVEECVRVRISRL
jgi:hypothetical protein